MQRKVNADTQRIKAGAKLPVMRRTFCVTQNTMDMIEAYAEQNECSMSDAVRRLIKVGFSTTTKRGKYDQSREA